MVVDVSAPPSSESAANGAVTSASYPPCTNPMVTALLTDMYQITMAYAYWKAGKQEEPAVFDLLFRKNPFGGEYTVFAGLDECIRFTANFRFTPADLTYLRTALPSTTEPGFFSYLAALDTQGVRIEAISEGSVVFPRVPLMRVEGPLLMCQLLETVFLNLVNFASLVATNAARHRAVAGPTKTLLEFGLRRAQGPDGGISASRYSFLGGFDATSNVEAGRLFGIPVRGTHAHAFVSSFLSMADIPDRSLPTADGGRCPDFVALVQDKLRQLKEAPALAGWFGETNTSELAAFVSYAQAFPRAFLALVDTYDVMRSGLPNFCAVALGLAECGYRALGVRLDSGDLAYQSKEARKLFRAVEAHFGAAKFGELGVTASNDINESTLEALNKQGHEIDTFGIGTHLVTCYAQPALGCVYKLVEIDGHPRIKLSQDIEKVTIPGKKRPYRLYGKEGVALVDLLVGDAEPPPKAGERILCRHPFLESKRAYVVPQRVEPLYHLYWAGSAKEGGVAPLPSLQALKQHCGEELAAMRSDHLRALNPTPYKVSVTARLYNFIHDLWLSEAPVGELA